MIRELELQRKSPKTIKAYLAAVAELARHFGRSPDSLSIEEIRDHVHHLIAKRKLASSSVNQHICGIRFLFQQVLGRKDFRLSAPMKRSGYLPEPLARTEIRSLLDGTRNQKHRVLLMTAYGAGLRVSELVRLQPVDIHSQRMMIRVNRGKGNKDRYTLLSRRLLLELRSYWSVYRPERYLFEGNRAGKHLAVGTAQSVFDQAKARAGVKHGRGIHSLRHSFGTHLMEAGVPIPTIQLLMGHSQIRTTMRYLHVTRKFLGTLRSPLDLLREPTEEDYLELS
jgi:site-specific recombinase XerD